MYIIKQDLAKDTVLRLFIIVDDLVKAIDRCLLPKTNKAGRKFNLTKSEIITIALLFVISNCNDFKHFYNFFDLKRYFPNIPTYKRTLESIKTFSPIMILILQALMKLNRKKAKKLIKLIDSAPLPVCKNKRIFDYISSSYAGRGKSSRGWFYGFKLHLIIDQFGNILNLKITPGSTSDRNHELVLSLVKEIQGILVGDTGYQSKPLEEKLREFDVTYITGLNKRSKQIVTQAYDYLRRLRQLIETAIGKIKYRKSAVSSLPRSTNGYMWRYIAACLSYTIIIGFF